jgi:hypothetical protein
MKTCFACIFACIDYSNSQVNRDRNHNLMFIMRVFFFTYALISDLGTEFCC